MSMIKQNKIIFRKNLMFVLVLFLLNACAIVEFRMEGLLKDYEYINYKQLKFTTIDIDKFKLKVYRIKCGGGINLTVGPLPIPLVVPSVVKNYCEDEGLIVPFGEFLLENNNNIDYSGISFQLKYNNKIYNHSTESTNLFKIPNYEEFKKAKDKTLIIHKKRDDGTTIRKEIPFEWKLTFETIYIIP